MESFSGLVDVTRRLSYYLAPKRIRDRRLSESLQRSGLSLAGTHHKIASVINAGEPALLSRPGGVESDVLDFFLRKRMTAQFGGPKPYPQTMRKKAWLNAGIAHEGDDHLDAFSMTYLTSLLNSDLIGFGLFARPALSWVQSLQRQGSLPVFFHDLEPFEALDHGLEPWTRALENKRVLVIHPFEESILSQYQKWDSIIGVKDILARFTLEVLRPPITFAGEHSALSWHEHLEVLKNQLTTKDFDVAIVGAGSYGLPIAEHAKAMGKVGLHLGGITQLLFGIRGRRWESRLPLEDWGHQGWVRPLRSEIPPRANDIERAAYW